MKMSKDDKEGLRILVLVVALFYTVPALMLFTDGVRDADYPSRECHDSMERWELLMPSYRIGCWFGKDIVSKNKCD